MYTLSLMSAAGRELAENINPQQALVYGLLGYLVVFIGLTLLMCVVIIMGKIMVSVQNKDKAAAPAAEAPAPSEVPPAVPAAPEAPSAPPAPGSAGEVKLFDVPDKEAAMLMAIVADKMGKPLNELRFKSIKEVK